MCHRYYDCQDSTDVLSAAKHFQFLLSTDYNYYNRVNSQKSLIMLSLLKIISVNPAGF